MIIEDGKFYFINDEFFNIFKDYGLMVNKENGNKRPCYFCFKDRQNKEIVWFVPISTKYDKYKRIYDTKKLKSGKKPVYNFVFGNVLGKEATKITVASPFEDYCSSEKSSRTFWEIKVVFLQAGQ